MTPFEGTSTCIETARPLQLLEVLSSVCALVFLSSRSLTSLQKSGGPLTSSRITPDSLLPFVHPPPLSSCSSLVTDPGQVGAYATVDGVLCVLRVIRSPSGQILDYEA